MRTNDIDYYKNYYTEVNTYKGEDWKHTSRMLVFQDWVRAATKPKSRILDIGCGDAIFAELMPEFYWYGVDINIDKAAARIPKDPAGLVSQTSYSRLKEQDLMKPPYPWPEGFFDVIVCSEVLEHLWDLRVVHKEAKRLLKRDGTYIISTPNHNWLANLLEGYQRDVTDFTQPWTVEHIRNYTFETHKKFLNEVGFVVEKHTGADGHFDPVTSSICRAIHEGLKRDCPALNVWPELLHKWAGEGISHVSHTTIISSKKI